MITINQIELNSVVEVDEMPFRSYIDNKASFFLLKRVSDIILSLLVIIFLLSWIVPLMAILIKLNSRGPVFLYSETCWQGIEKFWMYKIQNNGFEL